VKTHSIHIVWRHYVKVILLTQRHFWSCVDATSFLIVCWRNVSFDRVLTQRHFDRVLTQRQFWSCVDATSFLIVCWRNVSFDRVLTQRVKTSTGVMWYHNKNSFVQILAMYSANTYLSTFNVFQSSGINHKPRQFICIVHNNNKLIDICKTYNNVHLTSGSYLSHCTVQATEVFVW